MLADALGFLRMTTLSSAIEKIAASEVLSQLLLVEDR